MLFFKNFIGVSIFRDYVMRSNYDRSNLVDWNQKIHKIELKGFQGNVKKLFSINWFFQLSSKPIYCELDNLMFKRQHDDWHTAHFLFILQKKLICHSMHTKINHLESNCLLRHDIVHLFTRSSSFTQICLVHDI